MRFLFATATYKPARASGGPVVTVSGLAEALVRLGHHVTVIALDEDDGQKMNVPLGLPVIVDGVEVIYFRAQKPFLSYLPLSVFNRLTVRKWPAEARIWLQEYADSYDILHAHLGFLGISPYLLRMARLHRKPFFYHQRGNLDSRRFGRSGWMKRLYISWVERPVLRDSSVLWALSEREADVYRELTPDSEIQLLPNGIKVEEWAEEAQQASGSRIATFTQASGEGPLLVWFARWDCRKGPDVFVRTAQRLRSDGVDCRFLMAGPEEGEALSSTRRLIELLRLEEEIHLVLGLSDQERYELLQAADFFLLPTEGEGFSVGILEAMASGACVITTAAANFPDIEGCKLGHVVENSDRAFADAVKDLAKEDDYKDYGERARLHVKEYYAWSSLAELYLAVCRAKIKIYQ